MGAHETGSDLKGLERFLDRWSRRDFMRRAGGATAVAAFGGGALAAFLEACGNGGSGSTSPTTPKKGGHVTEGWAYDVKTFNSILSQDVYSGLCIGLINDALLNSTANGELIPAIAQAVPKVSSDNLSYEFKLRQDVKWSDGTPLTSEDVLFTYNLIFSPEYAAVVSPRRGDFTSHVASISAPDKYTFVVKTKTTYAPLLASHCQYPIMPKHVLGALPAVSINTADYNTAPSVTNGAFKFVRWDKGAQVVLQKNHGYYRGAPNIDQFVYKVVPSTIVVADQLKTGEIDVGQVDASRVAEMQTQQGVTLTSVTAPSFQFYMQQLNPSQPASQIFGDQSVRQALYYALDRAGIVKTATYGQAVVANAVEPPTSWAWNPNAKPAYSHNVGKANSLLDGAGWQKGADGIRAKNGRKLQFTMLYQSASPVLADVAQVMQQNWKAIGVDMTPQEIGAAPLVNQITNTRSFDMILISFTWAQDPDESQLFSSAGTRPGGFNGFDFKNDQVDQLLSQAVATLDQAKRKQLYFQYQDLMQQLLPAPALYFGKQTYGVNQRVKGYGFGTFSQYNRPWMKDVWVTDGK